MGSSLSNSNFVEAEVAKKYNKPYKEGNYSKEGGKSTGGNNSGTTKVYRSGGPGDNEQSIGETPVCCGTCNIF